MNGSTRSKLRSAIYNWDNKFWIEQVRIGNPEAQDL